MATYVRKSKVDIGFLDHSRESSKTSFYVEPLLADGSNIDDVLAAATAMHLAIGQATLCNLSGGSIGAYDIVEVALTPSDENAQREQGLWVQYVDVVTGKYYSMTIAGADRTLFAQINTDEVDVVSNVAAAALTLAIETYCVSEFGNAVQVTRMRLIGKAT